MNLSLFNLPHSPSCVNDGSSNPLIDNREGLLRNRIIESNRKAVKIPSSKDFSAEELDAILDGFFTRSGTTWQAAFVEEVYAFNRDGVGDWLAGSIAQPDWADSPISVKDMVIITANPVMAALCWVKNLPAWIIPDSPDAPDALERLLRQMPNCSALATAVVDEPDDPTWTRKILNTLRGKGFRGTVVDLTGQPLEPNEQAVPAAPIHVLPPAIQQMIQEVAAATGTPPDYAFVTALSLLSAVIGNRVEMVDKTDHTVRAHLAFGIVGPSGSTKSPTINHMLRPLREVGAWLASTYAQRLREYKKKFAEWKKQTLNEDDGFWDDEPIPPGKLMVSVSDVTREALLDVLAANPHGVLIRHDELLALIRQMDSYRSGRGGDQQFYLSLLSGQDLQTTRKTTNSVSVVDPFVSIIGALTPDGLSFFVDQNQRENGFLPRFLFVYPDPMPAQGVPEIAVQLDTIQNYTNFMVNLFQSLWVDPADSVKLTEATDAPQADVTVTDDGTIVAIHHSRVTWKTAQAFHRYHEWTRDNMRLDDGGNIGAFLSKLNDHVLRFALILAVLRSEGRTPAVDDQTLTDAITIADYFRSHALRVFPRVLASREEQQDQLVLDWIQKRRANGQTTTARDLQRTKKVGTKAAEVVAVLDRLAAEGLIVQDAVKNWVIPHAD